MNHVNTFTGGMNSDVSPEYLKPNQYIYGENFKLTVDEQNKTLNIDTGTGPKLLAYRDGYTIVGIHKVNDLIVLFLKSNTGGINYIYTIPSSELISKDNVIIDSNNGFTEVVRGVNLTFGNSLSIVHSTENDETWNVYFSSNDIFTPIRRVNILQTYENIDADPSTINLFNNTVIEVPRLKSIVAGSLKCGTYRYVYQIFDKGGSSTVYTPPSNPVYLTSSELTSSSNNYFGSLNPDENSGKGIVIGIKFLKGKYCRVVRMYYADSISLPICSIIYEGQITSWDFQITDSSSENVIGTTSIEDIALSYTPVQAKYIESKNGYLFLANIKEETFNYETFDARAYRRNANGEIPLYDPNTNTVKIYTSIPDPDEVANFCNPHNLIDKSFSSNEIGLYQEDGATYGGTGKWISYKFVYRDMKFSDYPVEFGWSNTQESKVFWRMNNMSAYQESPVYYLKYQDLSYPPITVIGYQRDEIYRFGIVIYNAYGQRTPVKWIDDIRFPNYVENNGEWGLYYSDTAVKVLGLQFKVDGLLGSGAVAYQIVRAIRTKENSTVLDAGILSEYYKKDGVLYLGNVSPANEPYAMSASDYTNGRPRMLSTRNNGGYHDYISPELAYYKEWRVPASAISAYNAQVIFHNLATDTDHQNSMWSSPAGAVVFMPHSTERPTSGTTDIPILDSYFYEFRDTTEKKIDIPIDSLKMYNETTFSTDSPEFRRGLRYSSMVLKLKNRMLNSISWGYPIYALRKQYIYPYGGYDTNAKENTKYIPCSKIMWAGLHEELQVFNGDTYIGIFEYMPSFFSTNIHKNRKQPVGVQALVESRINLWLVGGDNPIRLSSGETSSARTDYDCFDNKPETWGYWLMREKAGNYVNSSYTYTQAKDMYLYNSSYSHNDPKIYYYPPLSLASGVTEFPTRIIKTPKKLNNALSDTWSVININDYMDLDSKAGSLIKLIEVSQGLMAFQQMGIAIIPVEERALISDTSGSQLVAGKSGVLERYDYITNLYGITDGKHVARSANGIYFVDANKKVIGRISDKLEIISTSLGVQRLINSEQIPLNFAILVDLASKEVLFPVTDGSLLLYEDLGVFVSKLDSQYSLGLNAEPYCFGAYNDSNQVRLYALNKGNEGYYKTNVSRPTPSTFSLKYAVNTPTGTVNRLDEISLNAFFKSNPSATTGLLTGIAVENDYQNVVLTNNLPVRKFRNWRTNYLRDNDGAKSRLMDYYHIITLTSSKASTYRFIIKSIINEFTPIFNR